MSLHSKAMKGAMADQKASKALKKRDGAQHMEALGIETRYVEGPGLASDEEIIGIVFRYRQIEPGIPYGSLLAAVYFGPRRDINRVRIKDRQIRVAIKGGGGGDPFPFHE